MKTIKLILISIMSLFLLTGCVAKDTKVLVTSYPAEFLVQRIAGDRAIIERLDDKSGMPQRAQINPDYEELLKKSDVLFYISEMQPYWEIYKENIAASGIKLVDFADASSLYDFKRYTTVVINSNSVTSTTPYYEGALFEDTDIYNKDPFLWMDPLAMTSMAKTVRDYFINSYPDEKKTFNDNFDKLEIELAQLQANFQKIRDFEQPINTVTLNPVFGNWQRSFNIQVYPIILSRYGAFPTSAQKDIIHQEIVSNDIHYIFQEDGMSEDEKKLFNEFKTQHDLNVIEISNIFNLTEKDLENNEDYISLMYRNLENLEDRN